MLSLKLSEIARLVFPPNPSRTDNLAKYSKVLPKEWNEKRNERGCKPHFLELLPDLTNLRFTMDE